MISLKSMKEEFGSAVRLTPTAFKSTLELGKGSTHYYFRSVRGVLPDLLTTCSYGDDAKFAVELLDHVADWVQGGGDPPAKIDLPLPNAYGFDAAMVLPSPYHGHLKGVLDDKHATLVYCVPIHRCEFSGRESPAEYRQWQTRVGVEYWKRRPFPYVAMAFENPRSESGSPMVRTSLDACISDLVTLAGVTKGFAEVTNHRGLSLSIRPRRGQTFQLTASDREIECKAAELGNLITAFATTGMLP